MRHFAVGTGHAHPPAYILGGAGTEAGTIGLSEFFAMGGYGAYVWPAFGFAALVLGALLAQSWRASRRREAEFEQLKQLVRPAGVRPAARRPVPQSEAGIMAGPAGPGAGG